MPHLTLANVTLDVNDLDRGVRFWTTALGDVCVRRDECYAKLEHPADPRRIALGLQPTHGPQRDARASSASPGRRGSVGVRRGDSEGLRRNRRRA